MKLISLNTWGGKIFEPLMDFIKSQRQSTEIFCFQEIYDTKSDVKDYHQIRANLLRELKKTLPGFKIFYTPEFEGYDSCPESVDFDLTVGEAVFIKDTLQIINQEELLIYGNKLDKVLKKDFSNLPVTLQYISFTVNGKQYIVCNFHGTAFPGTKLDTPFRLKQSTDILAFLKNKVGAKIVIGDFNLLPQTESILMLEKDYRSLIKKFNIGKTRSNLSPYAKSLDFQKFADYAFVSKDITVISFEVPNIEISDHLPMILEFT